MENPRLPQLNPIRELKLLIESSGCETISLNQDILQNCAFSEFTFSPEGKPLIIWEQFLTNYKYVQFDGVNKNPEELY